MDVDHNGRITLEEFLCWYRSSNGEVKPVEISAAKALKENKLQDLNRKIEEIRSGVVRKHEKKLY